MAEAMASGKPVIATAYSGNLEFMDEENSLLVPYTLTSVPPGCPPYPVWAEWADADIDVAARHMRHVWENQDDARTLGARAQEDILRSSTPRRTAMFVARRLSEIRVERGLEPAGPEWRQFPGSALLDLSGRLPTRLLRRMLHRLLWPYLVEREEFDAALVAVLRGRGHVPYVGPAGAGRAEREVSQENVEQE
jgi:hypothetical protein